MIGFGPLFSQYRVKNTGMRAARATATHVTPAQPLRRPGRGATRTARLAWRTSRFDAAARNAGGSRDKVRDKRNHHFDVELPNPSF
jgi:hypothetical protein